MNDKMDAREAASDGMERAAEHADRVEPGWRDRAYWHLQVYAATHREFMTEDVRVWAYENGLPQPPDGRAWGAVTVQAAKNGFIVLDRYQKTRIRPAHATPRPVWRSRLYREAA